MFFLTHSVVAQQISERYYVKNDKNSIKQHQLITCPISHKTCDCVCLISSMKPKLKGPYVVIKITDRCLLVYIQEDTLAVWLSGNALALINVVALRQTRLVLGWVTVYTGKPSRYVTSQLGRLSLLPSVGQ